MSTITGADKGSGRTGIWIRAIEMIQDRPIFGVGIANFTSAYGFKPRQGKFKYKPKLDEWAPNTWATAHN